MNEKFQNALALIEQPIPPVWLMRQAGRYQKSYRQLREKYSFENLCKTPELSSQVGCNAVQEFDFDLCILFSDILFPLEALGMGLKYDPAPQLSWHLDTEKDLDKFCDPDEAILKLQFQGDCLKHTRSELPKDKSLIGFVGGFWTLFSYAVEGSHKGHMIESKKRRALFKDFTSRYMFPLIKKNIEMQLEAGAELVMIFDTAAGEVEPGFYKKEIKPFIENIAESFPGRIGYYMKGTTHHFYDSNLYQSPLAGFGWDHRWDLKEVLKTRDYKGFTQGNFDQALLHQNLSDLKTSLKDYLDNFLYLTQEETKGLVMGLGHGVLPKTPEENVKYFINEVREFFQRKSEV